MTHRPREEWLRDELRQAADDHRPDRAAIASRVAARRAAQQRRRHWRPLTAGAGVAVVVAVSVAAVQAGADESDPRPAAAGTAARDAPPAAQDAPPAAQDAPPVGQDAPPIPQDAPPVGEDLGQSAPPAPGDAGPGAGGAGPPPGKPPVGGVGPGLTATGSIAEQSVSTWTQNTVTVRNTSAVKGFRLIVTVAMTPGLIDAGRYTTVPNADLTMDVRRGGNALVYTYAIKKGLTLRPGTYEFGAQFNHRTGRRGGGDRFEVTATGTTVVGEFR